MHVVLVHRYFAPDTPLYASLLRVLAEELHSKGHRVTVLTAQPSYTGAQGMAPPREEPQPGLAIRRLPLWRDSRRVGPVKAMNSLLFAAQVAAAGARLEDVDVIMAATTPPIVTARAASFVARRHRGAFVYHNQDIYPEVAVAAGLLSRPWLATLLRRLDRANHRRADRIVVLSGDMRRTVEERGISADRISVINNFDPFADAAGASDGERGRRDGEPLNIVFAGNHGRFQGLETVLAAARQLAGAPVTLHFIGDGPARPRLEAEARSDGLAVRFHGYLPPAGVERFLRVEADIGIVSLLPGVVRAAYPSKTFSYLRQGCPVVALVESDSELVRTLTTGEIGFNCEPGDVDGFVQVVRQCLANRLALERMRDRAAAFAAEQLSPRHRLDEWLRMFESLAPTPVAGRAE